MSLEPKENVVVETPADDFDSKVDSFYTEKDKATPEDSSASKDSQPEETEKPQDTGDDQPKTPENLEKEPESKDGKEVDPRDLMFRKGYNEAKQKLEPIVKEYEGVKGQLEEFRKITSSPDYIRFSMKNQGYTEEAIDKKLTELGHKVQAKEEAGLDLVLNRLGVDVSKLDDSGKQYVNTYIADAVKVFDVLLHDRLGKILPGQIGPIQEMTQSIVQEKSATDLLDKMESTISQEGVLDFEKDVLPVIDKFLDENPKATQQEVYRQFESVNHRLSLERMKLGTKKVNRDASKENLRSQKEGSKVSLSGLKRTGDFDKDANAFFDAMSIKE